ncbi:hypothetical protein TWF192_004122 [Orbilia oligospora]|uniref:Uncharacterized protein n=1 Tax=Orbilia oligospora TaxID=2813651 RepID=A0A6G1MNB7_ORBOL|nr:hypothetical protein TWF191_009081 [Orbilia oligospora]KAF3216832.1 hypothetical protein TWF679_002673 [Orbilia oligospora]KAF3264440.1 hypothetical protein TWF192_004122 [Orbilia oligospora]
MDPGNEEPIVNNTFNNKRNRTLLQAGIVNGPIFNITPGDTEVPTKKVKLNYDVSLNLPFPRNRNFTGRRAELDAIDVYFSESTCNGGGGSVCAIIGTGGMGKTQIALEYAYACHETGRFTAIFWISTTTEKAIQISFVDIMQQIVEEQARAFWPEPPNYESIGARLGISDLIDRNGKINCGSDPETSIYNTIKSALFSWLKLPGNDKWLLIFDNADDLSFAIDKYFPNRGGCILVTSRRPEFFHCAEQINLDGLDKESAIKLLSRLTQLRNSTESEHVVAVVEKLGFMPLAITHAGCFIHEMNIPVSEYLQYYDKAFKEAQSKIPKCGWAYREDTAVTTWEVSFLEVKKQNEEAASLLLTCGYLNPNEIFENLWEAEDEQPDPEFQIQQKRRFSLLASYSLINRSQPGAFSVHPVVHDWTRERGDHSDRFRALESATKIITKMGQKYRLSEGLDGREVRRIVAHMEVITKYWRLQVGETLKHFSGPGSGLEAMLLASVVLHEERYERALEQYKRLLKD